MSTQAGRLVPFALWQQLGAETRGRNPTEIRLTALKSEERRRRKGGAGGGGGQEEEEEAVCSIRAHPLVKFAVHHNSDADLSHVTHVLLFRFRVQCSHQCHVEVRTLG